jgi:hypothetical protein
MPFLGKILLEEQRKGAYFDASWLFSSSNFGVQERPYRVDI